MNPIKYKFEVEDGFTNLPQTLYKQTSSMNAQPIEQLTFNSILRKPQIVTMNQVSPLKEQQQQFPSFRIKRAKSNQQKCIIAKRQSPILRVQTNKDHLASNSINKCNLQKQKSQYHTSSVSKIRIAHNNHLKSNNFHKIIDFHTKTLKIASKPNTANPFTKQLIREQGVSSRINNLYNIVIKNIEQDYNGMMEFDKFNSLMKMTKINKSEVKQLLNETVEQVKKYSNNQIYKEIRKQYKRQEQKGIQDSPNQKISMAEIKGVGFKKSFSNLTQRPSTKIKFSIKKPISEMVKKLAKNDLVEGW